MVYQPTLILSYGPTTPPAPHIPCDVTSRFLNPYFTVRFDGMTDEESAPLIGRVTRLATRPSNVYTHQWLEGDVLMWDNRTFFFLFFVFFGFFPVAVIVFSRSFVLHLLFFNERCDCNCALLPSIWSCYIPNYNTSLFATFAVTAAPPSPPTS
jgi:hypothetical protein